MTFDRFDVCEAYYLFATLWHGGQFSKEYEIFDRLAKIGFVPGFKISEESLTENGLEIYNALVSKVTN